MRWMNPDGTPNGERLDKLEALVKETARRVVTLQRDVGPFIAKNYEPSKQTEDSEPDPEADTPRSEIPKIPRRRRQRPRRSQ